MNPGERIARQLFEEEDKTMFLTFNSHNGQKALKILRERFYDHSPYSKGDSHHTTYMVGQQDVVGFILESIREGAQHVDI